MKYKKNLEVSEDEDRIYFTFYDDRDQGNIIALPKKQCSNKHIYAGTDFSNLNLVEESRAKFALNELMKHALRNHPATRACYAPALNLLLK